jgi:hypothetical protein
MAVSSDKGTVHVFSIKQKCAPESGSQLAIEENDQKLGPDIATNGMITTKETDDVSVKLNSDAKQQANLAQTTAADATANPKSSLSFFKNFLPKYFSSEWSFAQYRVPEGPRNIVAFGQEKNSIIVACANGKFYKALFDPQKPGVECVEDSNATFLVTETEQE